MFMHFWRIYCWGQEFSGKERYSSKHSTFIDRLNGYGDEVRWQSIITRRSTSIYWGDQSLTNKQNVEAVWWGRIWRVKEKTFFQVVFLMMTWLVYSVISLCEKLLIRVIADADSSARNQTDPSATICKPQVRWQNCLSPGFHSLEPPVITPTLRDNHSQKLCFW